VQLSPAASMTASVPNTARMLPAARCMCSIVPLGWGKGAGQGQRRDGIAQEFHFAAGERRSKVIAPCATDRIDEFGTLGRADHVDASAFRRCAIEERRHGHAQRLDKCG